MKKLFFTITLALIASGTCLLSSELEKKPATPNALKTTLAARFEAFKRYLFPKTEIISEPVPLSSQLLTHLPTTVPVIFYDSKYKQIELKYVKENILASEPLTATFTNITTYSMSPQKKYLLFQTTGSQQTNKTDDMLEGGISFALGKVLKRPIGDQVATSINVTKIIDVRTQAEIASFDGDLITYEFSPNEQTLLIARKVLNKQQSTKGARVHGQRSSKDTTRYDLFDITSQTIIKTFENVQSINYIASKTTTKKFEETTAISYTAEDNILIQYDNGNVEQITLQRNAPVSLWNRIKNMFIASTPQSSIQIIEIQRQPKDIVNKITYYDEIKKLDVTLSNKQTVTYPDVISYTLSSHKKYLVIMQQPKQNALQAILSSNSITMSLLNLETGKRMDYISSNTITYTFSPDENETRLLLLGSPLTYFTGETLLYTLVNLEETSAKPLTTFTADNGVYFKSSTELITIDKGGNHTAYDAITGNMIEKETKKENKDEFFDIDIVYKTIDELMDSFNQDTDNKNVIDLITDNLSHDDDNANRDNFIQSYTKYDQEIKAKFASSFFAGLTGSLQITPNFSAQGTNLLADINNDHLYIKDKTSKKIIFTSDKLSDDPTAIAFNVDDAYCALSYEYSKGIDIFIKRDNTFITFIQLPLSEFDPIIGLKFIDTADNTYLFFIDKTYKMGMYQCDIRFYTKKSTSKETTRKRPALSFKTREPKTEQPTENKDEFFDLEYGTDESTLSNESPEPVSTKENEFPSAIKKQIQEESVVKHRKKLPKKKSSFHGKTTNRK